MTRGARVPDELLARARRGDAEAVDEVFRSLAPRLAAYLDRHVHPAARRWIEPADIVQQSMLENARVMNDVDADAGEDEIMRRLCRTAQSRMVDALRRLTNRFGESAAAPGYCNWTVSFPSNGSVTREDEQRWLRELIRRLPEKYAEVVRLCALDGLSYVDAANELGVSPDAVRKRLDKAQEALARSLRGRTDE